MKLLIVESPAKAKTISKYINGLSGTEKFAVVASIGHIRDLPKSNKKAIDIKAGFVPHYEISKGKEKIVSEIKTLAKKADDVLLATDPDREGEAIAWHIVEATGIRRPKRIVFHEITKEAVEEAIKHPRAIDENLRRAQEARRVLDRLVGYDLSGLIWKKVRYGLSAGRVQSPALRILMEREREIRDFKPIIYFVITANMETKNKSALTLTCSKEPTSKREVESILEKGEKGKWRILNVEETAVARSPRAPFTTSTLQQAASSRLGFSPSRTMMIAQRLYEAGLITYMRTHSTNMSDSALRQIHNVVASKFGTGLGERRFLATKQKSAQEAHEAVRPTNTTRESAGANVEQKKLYNLIWRRAVASQMVDAKISRTKITANIETGELPDFSATGSRTIFPGWLLADTEARGEDVELPKVAKDDPLTLREMKSEEKQTEPPARYTEAGLVKELEKRGIGRPSTYASIIQTLLDREYVEKIARSLKPTDTGDVVSTFLENNFGKYINDTFTAEMEDELDDIATGKREYEKTLRDFYRPFSKDVKASATDTQKITNLGDADSKFKCPRCGSSMIIKLGRGGKFLSCSRYPDCEGSLTMEGHEIKKGEPIGIDPATGKPIFVLVGRYGPYVQLGERPPRGSKEPKPKMASVPHGLDFTKITLEDALKYLSLPRVLGIHPSDSKDVTANVGRFGPYVVHEGNFRSIKPLDDVYTISLERALELLSQPKPGRRKKKE